VIRAFALSGLCPEPRREREETLFEKRVILPLPAPSPSFQKTLIASQLMGKAFRI